MGGQRLIYLERERLFVFPPSSVQVQSENSAVDVSRFQNLMASVRIRKGGPALPTGQGYSAPTASLGNNANVGCVFNFSTSPGLAYPSENSFSGSRWSSASLFGITVTANGSGVNLGQTGNALISNPGAWLIWVCQNTDNAATYTFVADIFIVGTIY